MTHKKVTLAKVTAKNDPPESTRQDISRDKNHAKQKTFFCCDELPVRHMLIQLYLPLATMTVCVI